MWKVVPTYITRKFDCAVLKDWNYVERIKRHYRMFKDLIEEENKDVTSMRSDSRVKIGRNDPCPCGSGKKYKRCCMKKKA